MKLSVFNSTAKDGIMSKDEKYFPNLSYQDRTLLYNTTIDRFIKKYNLTDKVIIINENSKEKPKILTNKTISTKAKIVVLKETIENTMIGVETEDDPVIVVTAKDEKEKSTSAIALLTLDNLENKILTEIIDTLIKETNKAPFEMTFYISACASQKYYEITKDKIENILFRKAVVKKKGKYYLDIRLAIFNQLISEIADPNRIYFDSTDTVENDEFYSKYKKKRGKNLLCIKYIPE